MDDTVFLKYVMPNVISQCICNSLMYMCHECLHSVTQIEENVQYNLYLQENNVEINIYGTFKIFLNMFIQFKP